MRLLFLSLLLGVTASAQASGSITGTITDAETGKPLVGTRVFLVGTQTGAAAMLDGRYSIAEIPSGTHTVRVAYVGYTSVDTLLHVAEGQQPF